MNSNIPELFIQFLFILYSDTGNSIFFSISGLEEDEEEEEEEEEKEEES